jgi:hypothetical protein
MALADGFLNGERLEVEQWLHRDRHLLEVVGDDV